MIKIQTNPLILAAALGLLGPAALADDDDDDTTVGGVWSRATDSTATALDAQAAAGEHSTLPARLGSQLQLLPLEDAFIIDDGSKAPNGSWDTNDGIVQSISCDAGHITREFSTEGDSLTVHTIVARDDAEEISYTDVYTRIS